MLQKTQTSFLANTILYKSFTSWNDCYKITPKLRTSEFLVWFATEDWKIYHFFLDHLLFFPLCDWPRKLPVKKHFNWLRYESFIPSNLFSRSQGLINWQVWRDLTLLGFGKEIVVGSFSNQFDRKISWCVLKFWLFLLALWQILAKKWCIEDVVSMVERETDSVCVGVCVYVWIYVCLRPHGL